MSSRLVTVVIAAYRTLPDHLSAAVASALTQTSQEVEVIVSDDSPDRALEPVVSQFRDSRLRYRHNSPGLGVAGNHWACFREAKGQYIAVLNHDDLISSTFVERLVAPLIENPELALAFCDHWVIDEDGRRLIGETERVSDAWGRSKLAEGVYRPFFDLFVSQTIPMAMGTVFRRGLLPETLPEQAGPAYDLWLTYLLCRRGYGAYYVSDRLSSWRAHGENLTSQGGTEWSVGSAGCWDAASRDPALSSFHRVIRRKAALAYSAGAINSWRAGRRADCFGYGFRSLHAVPTWKGLISCLLSVTPRGLAKRVVRRNTRDHAEG